MSPEPSPRRGTSPSAIHRLAAVTAAGGTHTALDLWKALPCYGSKADFTL